MDYLYMHSIFSSLGRGVVLTIAVHMVRFKLLKQIVIQIRNHAQITDDIKHERTSLRNKKCNGEQQMHKWKILKHQTRQHKRA